MKNRQPTGFSDGFLLLAGDFHHIFLKFHTLSAQHRVFDIAREDAFTLGFGRILSSNLTRRDSEITPKYSNTVLAQLQRMR